MKDIPKSPRLIEMKRDRQKRLLRLIILSLILLFILVGAFGYFSSRPKLKINQIIVEGAQIIDQDEIEDIVYNNIRGKYIYIFSKSNFLIYPKHRIYNDLLNNFPRIENLSIYRQGLNILKINITERTGSYLYCGAEIPEDSLEIGENCYFINNDGYIFDEAPYFSGDIYFKYYVALENNQTSPLGAQVLSPENFHEIVRFIDGITALDLKPIYLTIGKDGINFLYLKTNTSLKPKIIFKQENDLKIILDNLSIAMKKKEFTDEIKLKYNNLSYIDLRFKNKVLYKFE